MSNTLFHNIISVLSSNIVSLIESIIIGLVVPAILGSTNYGYYRIFILYSSYAAFLHFGFVDGVVLKLGGKNYNSLNKPVLRSMIVAFSLMEIIISFAIILISTIALNKVYLFLFIAVGINTFFNNVGFYYQYLSQATLDFDGYSIRSIISISCKALLTIFLWLLFEGSVISNVNYKDYICISILSIIVIYLMGLYSYRDSTFGHRRSILFGFRKVIQYCRVGIYLTIAYQISNLIMIIDNQLVSMFFKTNTYGKYSFSYSMINMATIILGTVATVLLPHLKRDTFNHIIGIYHKIISSMMLVVYLALLTYFPLCLLVHIILPGYIQSLSYLKIFLPELGITCSITMITFNYYNALGKSKFYFYMSMVILAISVVIDLVMYMIFHTPMSIALGSFIAISIWYIASEYFLVKWYRVKWIKNFIYMVLMIGSFFISSMISNLIVGFCIYLLIYLIISWSMFKNIIKKNLEFLVKNI